MSFQQFQLYLWHVIEIVEDRLFSKVLLGARWLQKNE